MTKGTLATVTKRGTRASFQFDGDMGPEDLGREATEALLGARGEEGFDAAVAAFEAAHFGEEDAPAVMTENRGSVGKAFATFGRRKTPLAYYREWNSDYVYVLNDSGEDVNNPRLKSRACSHEPAARL